MEVDKRKTKRTRHLPRKGLTAAAVLLTITCFIGLGVQYLSFVSKTVYEESTSHLEEVLHKSNSMLSMIANQNISYLHLWNGFLDSNPDDDGIRCIWNPQSRSLALPNSTFFLTMAIT